MSFPKECTCETRLRIQPCPLHGLLGKGARIEAMTEHEARADERTRIVAKIRSRAVDVNHNAARFCHGVLVELADAIERGEHNE